MEISVSIKNRVADKTKRSVKTKTPIKFDLQKLQISIYATTTYKILKYPSSNHTFHKR